MVGPAPHHRFTFEDYLRVEEDSDVRHEFLDGRVWAMAGGTPEDAAICANIITLLSTALGGKRCRVYTADLRVRVRATGLATYPDASVICNQLQLDPEDRNGTTALNPKLLVEVLSPSTQDYDRGEKREQYQQIESLEEIVLVHHEERRIEVWRRSGTAWQVTEYTQGAIQLALGCGLSVVEIYRDPLA